jgi:hypothetical protein
MLRREYCRRQTESTFLEALDAPGTDGSRRIRGGILLPYTERGQLGMQRRTQQNLTQYGSQIGLNH